MFYGINPETWIKRLFMDKVHWNQEGNLSSGGYGVDSPKKDILHELDRDACSGTMSTKEVDRLNADLVRGRIQEEIRFLSIRIAELAAVLPKINNDSFKYRDLFKQLQELRVL